MRYPDVRPCLLFMVSFFVIFQIFHNFVFLNVLVLLHSLVTSRNSCLLTGFNLIAYLLLSTRLTHNNEEYRYLTLLYNIMERNRFLEIGCRYILDLFSLSCLPVPSILRKIWCSGSIYDVSTSSKTDAIKPSLFHCFTTS